MQIPFSHATKNSIEMFGSFFFPLSILSIPIFVYYLFIYLFLLVFSTNQTENIII